MKSTGGTKEGKVIVREGMYKGRKRWGGDEEYEGINVDK